MTNNFFKFKQFTVQQESCAMKVCTDACLFGSLLPIFFHKQKVFNALDIGTGTGLLSLMYAQKVAVTNIDAIEIEVSAAQQAQNNVNSSSWHDRINILQGDIKHLALPRQYEFIFSNPPFFENDLTSNNHNRNIALHSKELTLEELYNVANKYLTRDGIFSILLPYHRMQYATALCEQHRWSITHMVTVRHSPLHSPFRCILSMCRNPIATKSIEVIIRDASGKYSNNFTELLKDYYLYL